MDKYIVDKRVGCVAVYLKSREDETHGCHADDERNIFFAMGVRDKKGDWWVPEDLVELANINCAQANNKLQVERENLADKVKNEPFELERLRKSNAELTAHCTELVEFIQSLVKGSSGVAGYHLNGCIASWEELGATALIERSPAQSLNKVIAKEMGDWLEPIAEMEGINVADVIESALGFIHELESK